MVRMISVKDGRKLAYEEYGDKKGKPIFYFHGWPGSRLRSAFYDKIAKKLHTRIISPDRPGYGLSDYKENRTLLDYPDDILELADKFKIKKFAVVGVSGGGPYAAVCAYKIPGRIKKAGIVVSAGPMYKPELLTGLPILQKLSWLINARFPWTSYLSAFYIYFQVKYVPFVYYLNFRAGTDRKIGKRVGREFGAVTREAFRTGLRGAARDIVLYTSDWGFDLMKIKAKVYLYFGEKDRNVPLAVGKYFKKQIKGSKLIVYPNEGHLISITHAQEIFAELV